jgi:hypothetical protein
MRTGRVCDGQATKRLNRDGFAPCLRGGLKACVMKLCPGHVLSGDYLLIDMPPSVKAMIFLLLCLVFLVIQSIKIPLRLFFLLHGARSHFTTTSVAPLPVQSPKRQPYIPHSFFQAP